MTTPECPYCNKRSELVDGDIIYPHRADLFEKKFYLCAPCDAYVGCHPGGNIPLGRLANKELRVAKSRAHAAFDPIWRDGSISRKQAYSWLARELGIDKELTHIGMFDFAQCNRVVMVCNKRVSNV